MSVTVLKPGLLTSVQDLGRTGYQRYGVVVGGALDRFSARVANLIAGNPEDAAVLEFAQSGPELRFDREAVVAWCGGDFMARADGAPLPRDHAVRVAAGTTVTFGTARAGLRGWLAVAGGIAVPPVLGSRSTYRRAGLGGHQGRPLQAGDVLPLGEPPPAAAGRVPAGRTCSAWSIRPETLVAAPPAGRVRVMPGPEWEWFAPAERDIFLSADWHVTKEADRMGVRLEGPALAARETREMISEVVNEGIVQVPAGGQPIVLLASRQTVGGYPRLAAVATVDLGRLAQVRPGDVVRFQLIPLAEAHALYLARERNLSRVRTGLVRLPA